MCGLNFQSKVSSNLRSELGFANAALDRAVAPGGGLLAQEQIEELQMRQTLFGGAIQHGIQIVGRDGYSQDVEVVQTEIAKRGRRRYGILTKEFIPWICGTND